MLNTVEFALKTCVDVDTETSRHQSTDGSIKGEKPDLASDDSFASSDDRNREPSSSTPLSKVDASSKRSR